jgi:hypothetical protein
MPNKPIQPVAITSPGFFGINTQDSGVTLDLSFTLEADNAVIDKSGRMAARRGWEYQTTAGGTSTLPECMVEFDNYTATGSHTIISGGDEKLYRGEGTMSAMPVYNTNANATITYTISDNNWQFKQAEFESGTNFSPHMYAVQKGHPTLVYHKLPVGGGGGGSHAHTGDFGLQRLGDVGNVPSGYATDTFTPNVALSAFGRMWMANIVNDPLTIYHSVLLDGSDFSGSGSGQLNLEKVVPGGDKITALAAHNNFLVIFCEHHIVLYQNADDISNISLNDVIVGTGCIARDSVQVIGTDLVFLSDSGLRSLGRTIQEKSAPLRDLSKNVRDNFLSLVAVESKDEIRSIYYEKEAFYLLTLPASGFTFCFDVRATLPDGSYRVTRWDSIDPSSLAVTNDNRLLLGQPNGIAQYKNFTDGGSSYVFSYLSPYLDFGNPAVTKIPKKINVTVIGAINTTLALKWAFDYENSFNNADVQTKEGNIAEYGTAEYNVAEYSASVFIDKLSTQLSGNGTILQVGVNASIDSNPLSLQKIDIYSVLGRTI